MSLLYIVIFQWRSDMFYLLFLFWPPVTGGESFKIIDRQISQVQGEWIIAYRVRYCGQTNIEIPTANIKISYDAWVANSSILPHAYSRRSIASFIYSDHCGVAPVITNFAIERKKCWELIKIVIDDLSRKPESVLYLVPGQYFKLSLLIKHDHFLYGNFEPLLGERNIAINLGYYNLYDRIPLLENNIVLSALTVNQIPSERLETSYFHSSPDSLYLAAHIPGYQYFRFDDISVRFSKKICVSFWYLIALDTEGSCWARTKEYQDTPNAWYCLQESFNEELLVQGRWQKFEKEFLLTNETTTIALDFRIIGSSVGELWIDDIVLDYNDKNKEQ